MTSRAAAAAAAACFDTNVPELPASVVCSCVRAASGKDHRSADAVLKRDIG